MFIGDYKIDKDSPVLIIAELSANHNQNKEIAIKSIQAAKESGADAIKLQTYTPDTLTIDCDNEYFQIGHGTLWDGKTLYDLYHEAYTPWEWHEDLFREAEKQGLICFSSPFDHSAVELLEKLDAPAYKIASFEIQDIPLIEEVASKGKPVILSTGIARLEDIDLAIETCRKTGNNDIVVLKCTSSYPAPISLANLRTMTDMGEKFNVYTGLSDHTLGNTVPVTATALGARVIEKHFILDKSLGGPDADFSLDPSEFKSMVQSVRSVEEALGGATYEVSDKVEMNRKFARSLFVVKDIAKGEKFTPDNVRSIRPGYGLHPKYYHQVIGSVALKSIQRGTPLSGFMVDLE
ncbi:MAG: pseudaminic acid synthase [Bacteroidota bacterium]